MAGYGMGGRLGFQSFPSVDTTRLTAILALPGDVRLETTDRYIRRIVDAVDQLKTEFVDPTTGEPLVRNISLVSGAVSRKRPQPISGFVQVGRHRGSKRAGTAKRYCQPVGGNHRAHTGGQNISRYSESTLNKEASTT